jgi:hypothetical protein
VPLRLVGSEMCIRDSFRAICENKALTLVLITAIFFS